MRLKVLFMLVAICAALMATESFARDTCYVATDSCYICRTFVRPDTAFGNITVLDFGACDTVRIGCPVCVNSLAVGDSFQVPIYLFNDAPIGGFVFPFRHYGRNLRFGFGGDYGLDTTGGTVLTAAQQSGLHFRRDTLDTGELKTDTASALLVWLIDLQGKRPIAANIADKAKLLGYLYLVLTDTIHQVVRFDTAFYPPVLKWEAALFLKNGTNPTLTPSEFPKFVRCREVASPPCDINLGDIPCGDADGSHDVNIADAVYLVAYIFSHGPAPNPLEVGDVDCDGVITIADVVYLIAHIFSHGPAPCAACM